MYSPQEVANYFLKKGKTEQKEITPMKLQKLLYFAHGWYLAETGKPLLNETIEVWKYGPVVSSIYEFFKSYGNDPIQNYVEYISPSGSSFYQPTLKANNKEVLDILDGVWYIYSDFSARTLSNMTHEEGTPWSQIVDEHGGIENVQRGKDIEDYRIRQYFVDKLKLVKNGRE